MQNFAFDVFLSHNSQDKPTVERIAHSLQQEGVKVWLDKWHLIPGEPWQEEIELALNQSWTVAVFLGPSGVGPWENEEMRVALDQRARDKSRRVIPVLLPNAPNLQSVHLPPFLSRLTWVDFRGGLDNPGEFNRLLAGIRGQAPGATQAGPRFPLPKIPKRDFDNHAAAVDCLSRWSQRIDSRTDDLKKIGIDVSKEARSSTHILYRFTINGKRSYYLSIKIGDFFGPDTLMFLDGWDRLTNESATTATATVEWDIEREQPILRIMNFSLLRNVIGETHLTESEFFDVLWDKIVWTIEQLAR